MSNLNCEQLGVFDLETGFSPGYVSPEVELLMPWKMYRQTHNPHIRMWSGLDPTSGPMSYTIETVNDEPRMLVRLGEFLQKAVREGWYVTTWNGVYDVAVLIASGMAHVVSRIQWLDGMQLLKRVRSNDFRLRDELGHRSVSFGLKQTVRTYLPGINDRYDEGIDFMDASLEMTRKMAEYCVMDSIYTHTMTLMLANALTPREWQNALIESESIFPVADAYVRGLRISRSALDDVNVDVSRKIAEAQVNLYALDPALQADDFNVNSPTQLRDIVYTRWGHTPFKFTSTGADSVDKEVLIKLADIDHRCKALLEYRTALRNKQKFVDTTQAALNFLGSDVVHPQCNINGTYTGRMTVSSSVGKRRQEQTGIALHQWKREPLYRAMIEPPPGHVIVEADAISQEFRWMAIESGDPAMLAMCADGEDAHAFMGAAIRHEDYKTVQRLAALDDPRYALVRRQGKVSNLSCQYRTSAAKLRVVAKVQYGIDMDEGESVHVHQTYRQTYLRVPHYWNRQINRARYDGCVWTLAGRKLEITGDWGDSNIAWSMESSAINFPIQGVGADQKYLAIKTVKPLLYTHSAHFLFDLHDGIYFIVPIENAYSFCAALEFQLNNLPYEAAWGFKPPIPMPWEVKAGPNWGNLKPYRSVIDHHALATD